MKIINLTIVLLFISYLSFGQKAIKVSEQTKSFSIGSQNALVVNIYEADEDLINKEFKKLLKDFGAKVSSKKEIFADDASIKSVSDNTIDIYAIIEKNGDYEFNLVVGFDLGGAFLSSKQHTDKFKNAEKILKEFAISTSKEAVNQQLKEEERLLSKLDKDLESLIKENQDLNNDIENYNKKIKEAEENIKQNNSYQELKKKEILKKQEQLETIITKKNNIK